MWARAPSGVTATSTGLKPNAHATQTPRPPTQAATKDVPHTPTQPKNHDHQSGQTPSQAAATAGAVGERLARPAERLQQMTRRADVGDPAPSVGARSQTHGSILGD